MKKVIKGKERLILILFVFFVLLTLSSTWNNSIEKNGDMASNTSTDNEDVGGSGGYHGGNDNK